MSEGVTIPLVASAGGSFGTLSKKFTTLPYDYEASWMRSDGVSYVEIPMSAAVNAPIADVEELEFGCDIDRVTGGTLQQFYAVYPVSLLRSAIPVLTATTTTIGTSSVATKSLTLTTAAAGQATMNDVVFKAHTTASEVTMQYYVGGELAKESTLVRSTQSATTYDVDRLCVLAYYNKTLSPPQATQFLTAGRFKYLKLRSSTLNLDIELIPVVKDGVGYIYDRRSGNVYGNAASSGALVFGPRKN